MTARQQTPSRRNAKPQLSPHGATDLADVGVSPAQHGTRHRLTGGSVEGNERLTGATGVVLVALLAALGVTILRIRPLISEHLFIGLLLIPPVALKLASTGYRFVRYYTSDPVYRKRGAPPTALRVLAPLVVFTSLAVFATGVALLAEGPEGSGTLRGLHKASFIAWIAVTSLHILGHLPDIQKTFLTKHEGRVEYNDLAAGRTGRAIALTGALLAGVILAIMLIPHFGGWSHYEAFRLDH